MNEKLTQALSIIKNEKFEISNLDKFSSVYVFIKELKKITESVEKEASKKGYEMMSENEIKRIDIDGYKIIKQDPGEAKEYNAMKVIEALGMERASSFLKIDKTALDFYLKRAYQTGAVTGEEMMKCQENMKTKIRKGFIKLMKA